MDGRPESNWGSLARTAWTRGGGAISSGTNCRHRHRAPDRRLTTLTVALLMTCFAVSVSATARAADPEAPAAPTGRTLGDHFGQAAGADPERETAAELPTVSTPRLFGYAIAFIVLGGAGILLIRSARRAPRDPAGKRLLEVVGRVAVGPKQHLTLVRLRHRVFVLGVTSEQISLLDRLEDPTEVAGIVPPSSFERELQNEAIEEAAHELRGAVSLPSTSGARAAAGVEDSSDSRLSAFQHEFHRLRGVLQGLSADASAGDRRERRA